MKFSLFDDPSACPDIALTFTWDTLRNPAEALSREWMVTNGLGGYAAGTLATANTRRYHGLLVAALNAPLGRAVLLAKLEETLTITSSDGMTADYALSANMYPGTIYPQGFRSLQLWNAYPAPTWQWCPADGVTIEKRVWMAKGKNTTYIAYRLLAAPVQSVAHLCLVPLLAWRDYHSQMAVCDFEPAADWVPATAEQGQATFASSVLHLTLPPIAQVTSVPTTLELTLCTETPVTPEGSDTPSAADTAYAVPAFERCPDWYRHFQHPREQERGLDYQEELYTPGKLSVSLSVGQTLVVIASTEQQPESPQTNWEALISASKFSAPETPVNSPLNSVSPLNPSVKVDPFAQQLSLAADQFIVQVPGVRATIIAGYPWFCDWGRDTMIALPGLCLTTGKMDIARAILLSFAASVDQGMLPNRFPDVGAAPEYNTVDATLWYFVACYRYIEATGDIVLLQHSLWPVLSEIIRFHQQGTRYNIHVDPTDHLLYAGQPGVQLTWMDAKVGDWVVTPRIGKPVEINALWYNALQIMAHFATMLHDASAATYAQQAQQMQASFVAGFAIPHGEGLYDVLDTPSGGVPDRSLRPNQIFALSLPFPVVGPITPLAASIVEVVRRELLTPNGLRTLSPNDSAYQPRYQGDPWHRDGAYHQGTVWPWLLGPFVEAYAKVTSDTAGAKAMLSALRPQLMTYGIGSLAEIFDGSEPQRPNGCYAQAWSVGEILRVWHLLT